MYKIGVLFCRHWIWCSSWYPEMYLSNARRAAVEEFSEKRPSLGQILGWIEWSKDFVYWKCYWEPSHVSSFISRLDRYSTSIEKLKDSERRFSNEWAGSLLLILLLITGCIWNRPRSGRSAHHLRAARVLAYFQQCSGDNPAPFPYREAKLFAQTAISLANEAPYQVPITALTIKHLHSEVCVRFFPELESRWDMVLLSFSRIKQC